MKFSLLGYRNSVQKNLEQNERITEEAYQTFIALTASLCCLVHGFITTQSELLLTNELFMQQHSKQYDGTENTFKDNFLMLFFVGELFGMKLKFHIVNDTSITFLLLWFDGVLQALWSVFYSLIPLEEGRRWCMRVYCPCWRCSGASCQVKRFFCNCIVLVVYLQPMCNYRRVNVFLLSFLYRSAMETSYTIQFANFFLTHCSIHYS